MMEGGTGELANVAENRDSFALRVLEGARVCLYAMVERLRSGSRWCRKDAVFFRLLRGVEHSRDMIVIRNVCYPTQGRFRTKNLRHLYPPRDPSPASSLACILFLGFCFNLNRS